MRKEDQVDLEAGDVGEYGLLRVVGMVHWLCLSMWLFSRTRCQCCLLPCASPSLLPKFSFFIPACSVQGVSWEPIARMGDCGARIE
jgi:hypothetical protein